MELKRPNYVHISTLYRRTTFMFICQTVNSDFWKQVLGNAVLYSFIQKSAAVRFFEYAANSAGEERLRQEGKTLCLRGETGDIIFTEWNQRFIQNVASFYVLCLTKESVITATLVHAPVCVCVCATHTARRSEWYECAWNIKWRWVRIEFPPGPDPDRSSDFEKPWLRPLGHIMRNKSFVLLRYY